MASFFCASKIIIFITFTLYVLLGNTISASRVFVTVSLYSSVRLTVTLFFPNAIEKLFECRVSVRRIQVCLRHFFSFSLTRGSDGLFIRSPVFENARKKCRSSKVLTN